MSGKARASEVVKFKKSRTLFNEILWSVARQQNVVDQIHNFVGYHVVYGC